MFRSSPAALTGATPQAKPDMDIVELFRSSPAALTGATDTDSRLMELAARRFRSSPAALTGATLL